MSDEATLRKLELHRKRARRLGVELTTAKRTLFAVLRPHPGNGPWYELLADRIQELKSVRLKNNIMCLSKNAYVTNSEAKQAAGRIQKGRGVYLRTYKCPNCKWWHLTKKGAKPVEFYDLPPRGEKP